MTYKFTLTTEIEIGQKSIMNIKWMNAQVDYWVGHPVEHRVETPVEGHAHPVKLWDGIRWMPIK